MSTNWKLGFGNLSVICHLTFVIVAQAAAAPTITVYADGAQLQSGSTMRRLPVISAIVSDPAKVDKNSIRITIDGMITSPTIEAVPATTEAAATTYEAVYKVQTPLSKGSHIISASASNILTQETSVTAAPITVLGEVSAVQAVNYPNPFKPKQGQKTKITYTLTDDGNITLMIFDITGKVIKQISGVAGEQASDGTGLGGRSGYNEVEWNGYSDFGSVLGNGVYPYFVISEGKVLVKGQAAIYD